MNEIGSAWKRKSVDFLAVFIEQAKFDLFGVARVNREIHSTVDNRRAERRGRSWQQSQVQSSLPSIHCCGCQAALILELFLVVY